MIDAKAHSSFPLGMSANESMLIPTSKTSSGSSELKNGRRRKTTSEILSIFSTKEESGGAAILESSRKMLTMPEAMILAAWMRGKQQKAMVGLGCEEGSGGGRRRGSDGRRGSDPRKAAAKDNVGATMVGGAQIPGRQRWGVTSGKRRPTGDDVRAIVAGGGQQQEAAALRRGLDAMMVDRWSCRGV